MTRKTTNLRLSLPRCRKCDRHWRPAQGVVADGGYCRKCAEERRAIAAVRLELKPVEISDLRGEHLLPRSLRVG